MAEATAACAAFDATVVFLSHFKDLKDPRQRGKASLRLKRKTARWDDAFLANLIAR